MTTPNYVCDTTSIPENVDPVLGAQRNLIIERGRLHPERSEELLGVLASIYWDHQETASSETRFYLRDAQADFAVETGIDSDRAHEIWHANQQD